ncbi:MAG: glutathione ABC transporter substrate-binding protein [Candidatus Sumerlaeia bacterium]
MQASARVLPAVIVCLGVLAALAGCTDRRSPEEMKGTLVYGFSENFKTFDPVRQIYAQESAIIAQVLQPLVRWNQQMQLEPCLATAWETPDDCRTWIVHLRQGVWFHDGTPFTAAAVKRHFERHLDPAVGSTRKKRVEMIRRVEILDDFTVAFHLDPPNCIFPEILASTAGHIPSPAALDRWGMDFGRHPVGTGPFEFVQWVPDVRIELRRNERYWNRDAIHLERLIFIPVPENTTRLILLEQGVLDMADVSFAHVGVARRVPEITLQSAQQLSIRYIGFNTQKPPFNDRRVRQACNYAVNKDDIIRYMYFGVGVPAMGPLPAVMPDFNPAVRRYEYDPERAKALLAEAGYPDGFRATLWTTETGTYRIAAEATVDYLRRIGIQVEMKIIDNAAYWDKFDEFLTRDGRMYPTKEGVYDIYIGGWVGGESPDGFLQPLFTTGSYSNSSFYSNPRVDELVKAYRLEPDPEKRRKMYLEIQQIVVEDAPWIFAFHGQVNAGLRDRVKGFQISPAGWYFFEGVTVDGGSGGEGDGGRLARGADARATGRRGR